MIDFYAIAADIRTNHYNSIVTAEPLDLEGNKLGFPPIALDLRIGHIDLTTIAIQLQDITEPDVGIIGVKETTNAGFSTYVVDDDRYRA